jgi:hypothetical protein
LGNGVRYLDATQVIGGWRNVSNNIATVARSNNMRQIALRRRRTGLDYAPMSGRRITANPYYESSEVAPRVGSTIQVVWENADPDLIYPGMPVRYVYLDDNRLVDVHGTVIGTEFLAGIKGQGVTSNRYHCNVALTLFVDAEDLPTGN